MEKSVKKHKNKKKHKIPKNLRKSPDNLSTKKFHLQLPKKSIKKYQTKKQTNFNFSF